MKITILTQTLFILLTILLTMGCNSMSSNNKGEESTDNQGQILVKLKGKADSAMMYCDSAGLNTDYCILVDFSIHSGKYRIFVWDFRNDTIKYSGLCCHGVGRGSTNQKPVYSNEVGSNCSSLGHYRIGQRSYSQWGINVHYKMHGLDKSNDNSFKRIVVLHSHTPVEDSEIYPHHLPLGYSQGCPVVSNNMMRNLDALLSAEKKNVLLWIYE